MQGKNNNAMAIFTGILSCSFFYMAYSFGVETQVFLIVLSAPLIVIFPIWLYYNVGKEVLTIFYPEMKENSYKDIARLSTEFDPNKKNAVVIVSLKDHNGALSSFFAKAEYFGIRDDLAAYNVTFLTAGNEGLKVLSGHSDIDVCVLTGHGSRDSIDMGSISYDSRALSSALFPHITENAQVVFNSCSTYELAQNTGHLFQYGKRSFVGPKQNIRIGTRLDVDGNGSIQTVNYN